MAAVCCIKDCPSNMFGSNGRAECVLSGKNILDVDNGRLEPITEPNRCTHYAFKMRMAKERGDL
jgi:hypothetical protein